jgi:hypothetical protein
MDVFAEAEEKTGYGHSKMVTLYRQMLKRNHAEYVREEGRIEYQQRFDEKSRLSIPKHRVREKVSEVDSEKSSF